MSPSAAIALLCCLVGLPLLAEEAEQAARETTRVVLLNDSMDALYPKLISIFKKSPPVVTNCDVVDSPQGKVLQLHGWFGFCVKFPKALMLDPSVARVGLKVTLRKKAIVDQRKNNHLLVVALTSRVFPDQGSGGPFAAAAQDSGFLAFGYEHSLHANNFISWQRDGRSTAMRRYKAPFNLLLKTDEWNTWNLVYDNAEKTLCFYRNEDDAPFITQYHVDLSGVCLNSLWLGAKEAEYRHVEVYCERNSEE